jgi:hypothetical protein
MDADTADSLQRDQQLEDIRDEGIRSFVENALKDVHTCMPGIVQSFDPEKQTVTVQPAIKTVLRDDGPISLPICLDVPVVFPAGGNFVLTFPVQPDDECLLVFAERAIDFWWDRGGVQLPSEVRFHDLSDGFAIVGVNSRKKAEEIPPAATDACELRTRDGTTVLRVEGGTIFIGGKTGAELAIKGETYRTAESTVSTAWSTFLDALNIYIATIKPIADPTNAATSPLTAAVLTMKAAIATFEGGAPGYLAQIAKVL